MAYGWTSGVTEDSIVKAHANSGDLTYNGTLCGGVPSGCDKTINRRYSVGLSGWNTSNTEILKSGGATSCNRDAMVMWFSIVNDPSPTGDTTVVMRDDFEKFCQVKNVDECDRIVAKSDDVMGGSEYKFNNEERFRTTYYKDSGYPCILTDTSNKESEHRYKENVNYRLHKIAYHVSDGGGVVVPSKCFGYYDDPTKVEDNRLDLLTEVYFPSNTERTHNVVEIDSSAFALSQSLSAVTFGSVERIGASAFKECTGLTRIDFGNSCCDVHNIKYIGDNAFSGCTRLRSVDLSKLHNDFDDRNDAYRICSYAFAGCTSLSKLKLPNNLGYTTVLAYTFSDCPSLTSVTIPPNVQKIEECAFASTNGTDITSVTLNGITATGNNARIASDAFRGSIGLSKIYITSETNLTYANKCFDRTNMGGRQANLDVYIDGQVVNETLNGAFDGDERISFHVANQSLVGEYQNEYSQYVNWTFIDNSN